LIVVRELLDKLKSRRAERRRRKLERAAAERGAPDTRAPIVPQGSTLAPPISDDWK
jgi:hypothetical protein